jgi:hypothetical protein
MATSTKTTAQLTEELSTFSERLFLLEKTVGLVNQKLRALDTFLAAATDTRRTTRY